MLRLCQNFGTTSFFYSQDKEYSLVHIIIGRCRGVRARLGRSSASLLAYRSRGRLRRSAAVVRNGR